MPSPLGHSAVAIAYWPAIRRRSAHLGRGRRWLLAVLLLGALLAPDLDILAGPLAGQPLLHYHNGISHSLLFALVFGVLFGGVCRLLVGRGTVFFAGVGTSAYVVHVLLDACCWGRGVLLFWPFSDVRIISPVYLFLGVRHSCDAPWYMHVLTVLNELVFAAIVWGVVRWFRRPRSTESEPQEQSNADLAESPLGS